MSPVGGMTTANLKTLKTMMNAAKGGNIATGNTEIGPIAPMSRTQMKTLMERTPAIADPNETVKKTPVKALDFSGTGRHLVTKIAKCQ